MKDWTLMKRLALWFNDDDCAEFFVYFGSVMLTFFLFVAHIPLYVEYSSIWNVLAFGMPLISLLLFGLLKLLDLYVGYVVRRVTNGEKDVESLMMDWIFGPLERWSHDNPSIFQAMSAFIVVGTTIGILMNLLMYVFAFSSFGVPVLIGFGLLVGLHFMVVKGGSVMYNTKKVLDKVEKENKDG